MLNFDASVLPEEADGALLHFDSAMMPRNLQNEKQAEIWLEDMVKKLYNCRETTVFLLLLLCNSAGAHLGLQGTA